MKCMKCNGEIPENSMFCNLCGAKQISGKEKLKQQARFKTFSQCIAEADEVDYPAERHNDTKGAPNSANRLRIAIVIIGILIGVCAIIITIIKTEPIRDYRKAVRYLNNGDYATAIQAFQECLDYNDTSELLAETKYRLADEQLQNEDFDDALALFTELGGYKDAVTRIKETKFRKAIKLKKSNSFEEAISLLSELGDYNNAYEELSIVNDIVFSIAVSTFETGKTQEAKQLFNLIPTHNGVTPYLEEISFIDSFRGTWGISVSGLLHDWFGTEYYVIDGLTVYFIQNQRSSTIKNDIKPKKYTAKVGYADGEKCLCIESEFKDSFPDLIDELLVIKNNVLYAYVPDFDWAKLKYVYEKRAHERKSDSVDPYLVCYKAPRIGMTAEEVRNSTWGEPKDINSTITAYGTSEQWIYDHYCYIYLDDGIVTGIQN